MVKTLQQADLWLKERLNSGHYKEAAHCCMIFLRALNYFHNFSCCIDLTSKLLDIQNVITTKLDIHLLNLTQEFNPEIYLDLMAAYHSLGKCEAAIEKLALNFIQNIRQEAKNIFYDHFDFLSREKNGSITELELIFSRISTSNSALSPQTIISFVTSLCLKICKVVFIYFDIASIQERLSSRISEDSFALEILLNRKLIQGRTLIWRECEMILVSLLNVLKFDHFSHDNLLNMIKIMNMIIALGKAFCDSPSSSLVEAIRNLSLDYFKQFHKLRMDDLKIFLENESWELCPLPFNFTLEQFNEFSFLQSYFTESSLDIHENNTSSSTISLNLCNMEARSSFLDYFEHFNTDLIPIYKDSLPLLLSNDACNTESFQCISQTDILVANTSLITLRCIGRYIQIMMAIKIIAFEIFQLLTQLYKYYFLVMNIYFADKSSFPSEKSVLDLHGMDNHQNYYSTKLNTVLSQIGSELSIQHQGNI